jgi:hypothetical protein
MGMASDSGRGSRGRIWVPLRETVPGDPSGSDSNLTQSRVSASLTVVEHDANSADQLQQGPRPSRCRAAKRLADAEAEGGEVSERIDALAGGVDGQ